MLNKENQEWLDEFQKKHGHAPHILHIGNIANNAYNNAKLLNRDGFDCDVLCYNYYHMMGTPEWEDADFEGDWGNDFFPNWRNVNLHGFERPVWFAQGSSNDCISYLKAKRKFNKIRAKIYWNILISQSYNKKYSVSLIIFKSVAFVTQRIQLKSLLMSISFVLFLVFNFLAYYFTMNDSPWFISLYVSVNVIFLLFIVKHFLKLRFKYINEIYLKIYLRILRTILKRLNFKYLDELIKIYKVRFPERNDKLNKLDFLKYLRFANSLVALFDFYDIIIAYSTDPIYPLLAGKRPYFAFEHGTLRTIPFEENSRGRLTSLAYSLADAVFVTNMDCLEKARRLQCNDYTFINHPYDEDHSLECSGVSDLQKKLKNELDADFLVFFPTRHDWVQGKGFADKGNNIFINAFIELSKNLKIGMICCDWGKNVNESKKLLKDAGLSHMVKWKKPLGVVGFDKMCLACDISVDQFLLGSFGGITFKALAAGAPVCTYLNIEEVKKSYDSPPPVINCHSSEDIIRELGKALHSPEILKEYSEKSRKWIKKYHNSDDTVNLQVKYFSRCKFEKKKKQKENEYVKKRNPN